MTNIFDQFDAPLARPVPGNVFDQFDAPAGAESDLGDAARFAGTAAVRGLGGFLNFATDPLAPIRTMVSPDWEEVEKQRGLNVTPQPGKSNLLTTNGESALGSPGTALGDQVFNATGMREMKPQSELGRVGLAGAEGAVAGGPFGLAPAALSALGAALGQGTGDLTGSHRLATAASLLPGLLGKPIDIARQRFQPPETQAVNALSTDISRGTEAGGPSIDALRAALGQGDAAAQGLTIKPLALADVGGVNVQGRGEAIANSPGEGSQIASDFLRGRDAGAGPRLLTDLNENLGAGPSAFKTAQILAEQRAAASAPLYERALNTDKPIQTDRLDQFIKDPILQQGLAQGVELQRLEALAKGTPFNPNDYAIQIDETGTPRFSPTPNMRTLDTAKRGLDNILDQYRDPASGRLVLDQRGRAIDQVRQSYLHELDAINPDYAAARQAWSGPSQSMSAMKQGADIFNQQPEQISENIGRLATGDKQFFLLGARDALAQRIAKTSAGGNEALRIVGNQQVQNQLRPLFPDDKSFSAFVGQAQLESLMYRTMNNTLGNSRTFARAAYSAGQGGEGGGILAPAVEAGAIAMMHPSAALPALMRVAKGLAGAVKGTGQPNAATQAEIARMLFSSDPAQNAATLNAIQGAPGPGVPFSLAPMLPGQLMLGERPRQ